MFTIFAKIIAGVKMKLTDKIEIKIGDITKECSDAIVNAANSSLLGGGGVDGAIHQAGGAEILKACQSLRDTKYPHGLPTGQAVTTMSGNMCSKYVIHTVGPVYSQCGDGCSKLLSECYTNSLKEAVKLECKSISFPAISTGIYGYPKNEAFKIAYKSVVEFTKDIDIKITFVFHSQNDYDLFLKIVKS